MLEVGETRNQDKTTQHKKKVGKKTIFFSKRQKTTEHAYTVSLRFRFSNCRGLSDNYRKTCRYFPFLFLDQNSFLPQISPNFLPPPSSHFSIFCRSPQYSVSYVETLHRGLLQNFLFDIVAMSLVLFCFGLLLFFGILYGLAASIFL